MNAEELFRNNVALVERIAGRVCRRAGLYGADADDFRSSVMLALIEDDYAVVRKYAGRSSFSGYLAVVIEHFLTDQRVAQRGKWHSSAEAERLGLAAVALERLVHRDGRPLDAALPLVQAIDPGMTRAAAVETLHRLPARSRRPRAVELDAVDPDSDAFAAGDRADARAVAAETVELATSASRVVRRELDALPSDDRLLLRLRFGACMSIADVSRALQVPQRPLYRRIEALLGRLRSKLRRAGVDAAAAADLIGADCDPYLDFGLDGKSAAAGLSSSDEELR